MSELAWITARIQILEQQIQQNGSTYELKPTEEILQNAEQAFRVKKQHRVNLTDAVLVETKPDGARVNHWRTAH